MNKVKQMIKRNNEQSKRTALKRKEILEGMALTVNITVEVFSVILSIFV